MIATPVTGNFKAEALSDECLRTEAPSIFARAPMSGLSRRYTFVPTTEIIAGLRQKDWLPVTVEQQRVRLTGRIGFQKHLIRFRRAEQMQNLDEWNEELVLTNSHDAGCAYTMRVGIFRRICSNGLVMSDESFESIRFRHAGLKAEEVVAASCRILEFLPKVAIAIDRFRNRQLTAPEMHSFAERALLLRCETAAEAPVCASKLLEARRAEDTGSDLWVVLNRVQENLVRGGLSDTRRSRSGRLRTLRSIRGIDSKMGLNRGLWKLADELLRGSN